MSRRMVAAGVLVAFAIGCAPAAMNPAQGPAAQQPADWTEARERLATLRTIWRSQEGTTPVVARFSGVDGASSVEGRGALAVRSPDAIRMILVTAGGPTAFDLWIRGEQFRMAMPLRDRIVRGREGERGESSANLPIGFLRWWLLTPLQGKLTAAYREGSSLRWILQDGRATYDVRQSAPGREELTINRRNEGASEQLEVEHPACPRAEYRNERLGLQVVIACDPAGERKASASERAFEDPDATRR